MTGFPLTQRSNKADYTAERYIPKESRAIEHPEGAGVAVIYLYVTGNGKLAGIAYQGNAGKYSFHYSFKNIEQADSRISEFFEGVDAHHRRVAQYRADSYAPHSLKVGDVITNSWGYDQTNVDWYRVSRVSLNFVWLKPIAEHVTADGFMSGKSSPGVDCSDPDPAKWGFQDLDQPEEKHRATGGAHGDHVTMKFGSGSKWDGQARYASWYA